MVPQHSLVQKLTAVLNDEIFLYLALAMLGSYNLSYVKHVTMFIQYAEQTNP